MGPEKTWGPLGRINVCGRAETTRARASLLRRFPRGLICGYSTVAPSLAPRLAPLRFSSPSNGSMAAASLPADLQAELNALILSLEGLERARYLAIASIACFLYDFAVTFDQEVRSGPSVFRRLPR